MKKNVYQLIQHLAASIFIGIAVFGVIIYKGGKVSNKIPVRTSLLLGLVSVVCVIVFVYMGSVMDRIMAEEGGDEEKSQE